MHLILDGLGPLSAQVARSLRAALGSYSIGVRLPPTRLLAQELGVSRNTVLAAYEQLRAEGLIEARVGSGSYTTSQPPPIHQESRWLAVPPQSRYAARARGFNLEGWRAGRANEEIRYAFQYGLPLVNPALAEAWGREISRAAAYASPNYPDPQGILALREAICDYLLRRRGVLADPDDVLVVNGTQQAISLIARVLLDEGDSVAIEEPQYYAMRRVLQFHGANLVGVPVDEGGLCCDQLPAQPPKLICVTPSHQFPTGVVLSASRRKQLLEYAKERRCWILEDDYDGEFRYADKPLPALRSTDENDRVIYVGSFSKTLFPSLRLGYLVMPRALRRDFIATKWASDFGAPSIEQTALARYMKSGAFERHLRRTAPILYSRRAALIDGLRKCDDGRLDLVDSRAGMHIVVWLRERSEAQGQALIDNGRRQGLGLHSIGPHFIQPPDRAGLLMGFGGLSVSEIEQGLEIFSRCLDECFSDPGRRLPARGSRFESIHA
jgi:GntR family transcriptional regulator/MocR family aminotransferase